MLLAEYVTCVTGTGVEMGGLRLDSSGAGWSGEGVTKFGTVEGNSLPIVGSAAVLESRSKPHCPQNLESVCTGVPQLGQLVVAGKGV